MANNFDELPSQIVPSPKEPKKGVEFGEDNSASASLKHIKNPLIRKTGHLDCEYSHPGASGHNGPATHFFNGEAVCGKHLERLQEAAVRKNDFPVVKPIKQGDVEAHKFLRASQRLEVRTAVERLLYSKGMRGEDAIVARKTVPLGGTTSATTALDEAKSRRTPDEQASILEKQLELVRKHGGHVPLNEGGEPNPSPEQNKEEHPELYDEKGRIYRFPKKSPTGPRVTKEDDNWDPGQPGITPRGFSKTANRAISVPLTAIDKEKSTGTESFSLDRSIRQREEGEREAALESHAEKMRKRQAQIAAITELRNANLRRGKDKK